MTSRIRVLITSWVLAIGLIGAADGYAQPAPLDRDITPLKGDLYWVRVGDQRTVFLATPSGIALVDPLSVETAQWLKEEFSRRFPPGTVKYVVHTTHFFDRAEGGVIFLQPAELVGQREFNSELSATRGDGRTSIPVSDRVRDRDRNGDGLVTADELYRRVHDVESHFDARRVITLGGRTIELVHAPTAGAPENTIVNFPAERTAFASLAPPLDDAPFTFGEWRPSELQRWLAAAASLQFDQLVVADGRSIPRARIALLSAYVSDLIAGVTEEYEGGRSAGEFPEGKLPQAYRSNNAFREWRSNVADVYGSLSVFRVEATAGALAHYTIPDTGYCASFTTCSTGGLVPAVTGSLSAGVGRWAGVAEFSVTDNSFTTTASRFVDEDFALVETRTSIMLRHTHAGGAVSLRLLGGLSYTIGDRSGQTRFKEGLPPFAGRHPLESQNSRWGYTGGLDLVFGHRIGIVVPLRFNYAQADSSGTFPNRMDTQAGLALTLRLFRSID